MYMYIYLYVNGEPLVFYIYNKAKYLGLTIDNN